MGKQPAFQFYPNDWSRDLEEHPLEIEGAWIRICCKLWWAEERGKLNRTVEQWARILRISNGEVMNIVNYIKEYKIGDVTICNKLVTVINRRMYREYKERENTRLRVRRHRERQVSNTDITPPSSSSSSSSVTSSKEKKEEVATDVPTILSDLSYEFLKQQAENFPNESALKNNFDHCVIDGAKKLSLFQTENGWDIETIGELLNWILLESDFWRTNIRTLGNIRKRKSGKGSPMKFENALASMKMIPKEETLDEQWERIEREKSED